MSAEGYEVREYDVEAESLDGYEPLLFEFTVMALNIGHARARAERYLSTVVAEEYPDARITRLELSS